MADILQEIGCEISTPTASAFADTSVNIGHDRLVQFLRLSLNTGNYEQALRQVYGMGSFTDSNENFADLSPRSERGNRRLPRDARANPKRL